MKRCERCQVTSAARCCREPQLGLEALAVPEAMGDRGSSMEKTGEKGSVFLGGQGDAQLGDDFKKMDVIGC